MAILDHEIMFEDSDVTIAGTRISTNVYDALAAINLGGASARRMKPIIFISAKTGTPTLSGIFVGSDVPALTPGVGTITLATLPSTVDPAVPALLHFGIPSHSPRRYYGWSWTISGGTVTAKATLVEDDPNSYPL